MYWEMENLPIPHIKQALYGFQIEIMLVYAC